MSVKMPKPVSKTELSRLYTRLAIDTHHRLDNSTAEGQARLDLLHRFFDACANLYGTMTLWHAWELFQHVEPELTAKKKILRKDFFSFAEIVRVEKHAYAIMLLPDLYEEETSISIQDAELVHRMLIYPNIWGLNEYYKLLSYQDDKPCVVPARDAFYAYADPNYFWGNARSAFSPLLSGKPPCRSGRQNHCARRHASVRQGVIRGCILDKR